ncbi:MAG: SpoIVB peptidase [Eubacteriales bacterium]|nr:SpoIVB peptidase [Eubacteriales bacterium]
MKKRCRRWLLSLAVVCFGMMMILGYRALKDSIPDEIRITEDNDEELPAIFSNPLITWEDSIPASGGRKYTISCRLLNTVFLKNVHVEVMGHRWVRVSGSAVGIYMETEGILIVDTEEIKGEDGIYYEPAENLVQPGDYITAFNQKKIATKRELIEAIQNCDGNQVQLSLVRDGKELQFSVNPVKCGAGDYKLGIWVRDDTQGIGTLTYVEPDGSFGALGHGISDVDTGNLLRIKEGTLYETEILGINKGSKGTPGELSGLIRYDDSRILGSIQSNTENGIFGNIAYAQKLALRNMEVGYKQEIKTGPASVLCAVDGQVEEYHIEITDIDMNHKDSNKSFTVKVTDERLLKKTGGIVQGMSGSPVIQNGKFVGAITHVFVQDSAGGYGIFAETMLTH